MGRIRLQICVLPWEHPGPSPSPSSSAPAPQEPLKWCEPCTENTSMQEVCDSIYKTWKRMWKDSEGPLRIRHLKTAYGDFVDLEERVVGELFDDRGADGDIRNSILEVHRYPPTPDELERVQRFTSFAPTSSARPRKRPLELPSQSNPSKDPRITHGQIRSIEEADADTSGPFAPAFKRQCTRELRLNRAFDPHQPLGMREEQGGQLYHSSQISGTQESIHQVPDSQKSPGKKQLNPYGTPSSLSIIGQQDSVHGNEVDLSAIPDSPFGRDTNSENEAFGGAMSLDQGSTNSPELRGSIPQTSSHSFRSASQQAVIPLSADNYMTERGIDVTQSDKKEADMGMCPKRKSPVEDSAPAHNVRVKGVTPQKSDPIFDPIESDNESFHEKQQMQSAKRLKSRKTPNTSLKAPRASDKAGARRGDGQFLVPSVPQPRSERARISLDQVSSQGQRQEVHTSRRDATQVDRGVHANLKRHANIVSESVEHAHPEACGGDQNNKGRKTPRSNSVYKDVVDTTQTSSQATTTGSQESGHSPGGTSKSITQQRDDIVSSQEREMNETNYLGLDDDHVAQEAERIAKDAEEQQEKRRIREKKLEEERSMREAVEVEDLARNKEVELKATKERLAVEQAAKEEKARAEQLAQVQMADAGEERFAEAKPTEKTTANAARLAEEKKRSERMARERQKREAALAQKAENFMATADGAKQIELEKKEKELARLKALSGERKNFHDLKADEQARGIKGKGPEKNDVEEQRVQQSAQKLADIESNDVEHRTFRAKTPRELAMAIIEEHQKRIPDKEMQKLRNSMEKRSRASTMSLASSDIADAKRSMTPRIPGSSVLRSSPLSNRSTGNMEAPLRSALRQPSSALKRSVSSVSFDVPPSSKSNEYVTSTPNPKALKDINNESAARSSSKINPKNAPRSNANQSSNTPMKTFIPKKALDTKSAKTPGKNGKVQTKLNVIREVKKLKGPATGLPITATQVPKQPPKQAQKQEIVLSSGEDSTTSEEPKWQTGNAEAGPSSRRPLFPVTTSQGKRTGEVKPPAAPIDPVIRNVEVAKYKTSVPATPPHSTPSSNTKSLQESTSRSPASSLSGASSMGSGSGSEEASDSDLQSDSEEEPQAPSPVTPTGLENGRLTPITTKAVRKAASTGVKDPKSHLQGKATLQSIEASSSRPCSTKSIHDDGKHVNQAADRQLQLESRLSLPSIRSEQASSIINGTAGNKLINQGLDHAGRLPNGTRPAYYKYPQLSELQKVTREATPMAKVKSSISSTQPLPLGEAEPEQSSSDGDESESDSDLDENENTSGLPSQAGFKKSGHYPGIGKVIKLAKAISKIGHQ